MINGVLTAKLSALDGVLTELRSLGNISTGGLSGNWQTRRAVERIVNNRLGDFERFRNEVLCYAQREP